MASLVVLSSPIRFQKLRVRGQRPSLPTGLRIYAVGDIHGRLDLLDALLARIDAHIALHPTGRAVQVFLGDYIDRGPAARDVIELLLDLRQGAAEYVFLKGNHEDMMLSFLGLPGHYGESFLFNGGAPTLESYGVPDEALALERIPTGHLDFLKTLATSYLHPPYLFVHAGISPLRQLEEQSVEVMLWIRQEFVFKPHQLGATVVLSFIHI